MSGESNAGLLRRYATASVVVVAIWLVLLEGLGGFLPFGQGAFSGRGIQELAFQDYAMLARAAGVSLLAFVLGFGAAAIVAGLIAILRQSSSATGKLIALPFLSLGAVPVIVFAPFVIFFFGLGLLPLVVMIFVVTVFPVTRMVLLSGADYGERMPEGAFDLLTTGSIVEPDPHTALLVATALRSNVFYALATGLFGELIANAGGLGRVIYIAALNTLELTEAMAGALLYALGGMAIVLALEMIETNLSRRSQA